MNRARTGKREKKTRELETRVVSSPDLSPEVQWFNPLSSSVVVEAGDSLGLRVRRVKGRSPNNASSFIASRFIAGQRNGSAENVRPRETERRRWGWKEVEDLRTEIAMRAVTAVMKKALDYAPRTALKAAAIADLLIVIVLILKE